MRSVKISDIKVLLNNSDLKPDMTNMLFTITQTALRTRLEKLEQDLLITKEELKSLDSTRDGDMMDDPLMHLLLERQEMQSRELMRLKGYLSSDYALIPEPLSIENAEVSLGHQVGLKVVYEDGDQERFTVTIGTTLDKQYLSEIPAYSKLFNDVDKLLISNDTPLAKAIIGKRVGETTTYEVNSFTHEVKILKIENSPLSYES